jgi:TonB family protein
MVHENPTQLGPPDAGAPTANERLRASWGERLRWSGLAAVVAHLAAFAFSPSWFASPADVSVPELSVGRLVALPDIGAVGSRGSGGETLSPAVMEEATAREGLGDGAGGGRGEEAPLPTLGELWDAFGDRFARASLAASLAEPAPVPEKPFLREGAVASRDGAGSLAIGGTAATAGLVSLTERDSLALDRLSALQPELSFTAASMWVLIRNQEEVETFLRRAYRTGRLERSAAGSVGVTLWIDRRGSVEWAEVTESSGRRDLDEFTLALFNEVADFRAARERGVPVSRSVTFRVNYPW